jgi:hypothetical protein
LPVNRNDILPAAGEHRTDAPSYETSAARYKYHVFPAPPKSITRPPSL